MTLVRQFHEAFDLPRPQQPHPGDVDLLRLRLRLIAEEYKEVRTELDNLIFTLGHGKPSRERVDMIMVTLGLLLKELCDLRYVAEGTAVSLGLDIDGAYAEVHRSNMSKLGLDGKPVKRADGKVLKGPGYFEPNMLPFVSQIIDINPEEG